MINHHNLSHAFVSFLDANNVSQMITFLTQDSGNTLDNMRTLYTLLKKPFS